MNITKSTFVVTLVETALISFALGLSMLSLTNRQPEEQDSAAAKEFITDAFNCLMATDHQRRVFVDLKKALELDPIGTPQDIRLMGRIVERDANPPQNNR